MYSKQDNQTPNETVTFNDGEEIVTFNSDGTYSSYYDSDIALGTYSYDTDNQEITTSYIYEGKTYTGVAKVMELNSISLILYCTDEDGLSYIDYYKRKK